MDTSEQNVLVARSHGHRLPEMTEAGLLVVAKRGEMAAFDLLYRAYAGKILRTVRRITRNHEDAEDAVHDAFLKAFLHIQTFDGRSAFSTWLTRIGINSALMMLGKKRNSREVMPAKDRENESSWEATDPAPVPEQQYAEQEPLRLVRDAIAGLPPSIRRALEMHTLQGRSVEEMASKIGISVCAAKGRLFHARRRCVNRKFCEASRIAIGVSGFRSCRINCSHKRRRTRMKSESTQTKPSIVFCHGLWADGSCFSKVIPALQAGGHQDSAEVWNFDEDDN